MLIGVHRVVSARIGQIPERSEPVALEPVEGLVERYREYLVVERGAARTTVVKYEHVAWLFLNQQSTTWGGVVETLDGAAVTKFIA